MNTARSQMRSWTGVPVEGFSGKQVLLVAPSHGVILCSCIGLMIARYGDVLVALAYEHMPKASHRKAVANAYGFSSHAEAYAAWIVERDSAIPF
jgi:hypothetical protein